MVYEKCGMGVQLETTCRFEMPWMDVALYFDYFGSESVNLLCVCYSCKYVTEPGAASDNSSRYIFIFKNMKFTTGQ